MHVDIENVVSSFILGYMGPSAKIAAVGRPVNKNLYITLTINILNCKN
jgi:hypothetical protein